MDLLPQGEDLAERTGAVPMTAKPEVPRGTPDVYGGRPAALSNPTLVRSDSLFEKGKSSAGFPDSRELVLPHST